MATLSEAIMRVVYKVEGQSAVKSSRRDVQGIEGDAQKLNATLLASGAAFAQFSKVAIQSFGQIETAMAKFASRAGWELGKFRRETEQATHDIARLTGVRHGIVIQAVQEGISQGALQGMKTPEILKLVREGAKLHAAGQTDLRHAVSSAITARQYGAPSAPFGQRLIYSASQVGAGDPAQYGKEYKDVAPGGHLLNIEMSETLGALALIAGAAPSLAEGATWIKALYRTLSNPQEDAQTLFRQRMGYEFTEMQDMVAERGGLNRVVRLLTDNFEGPELMAMFGRQEAVQGLAALGTVPGQLLRLQNAVRENAIDDPVARAWEDNLNTWGVIMQSFQRSLDTFMRSVGTPLVAVMKEVVKAMSWLLDSLTWLNDTLFRIPGALAALVGALIGLRSVINLAGATFRGLRGLRLLGGEGLSSVLFGSRVDADTDRAAREAREDARDARTRNTIWSAVGAEAAADFGTDWLRRSKPVRDAQDFASRRAEKVMEGLFASTKGGWTSNYGESVDRMEDEARMREEYAEWEREDFESRRRRRNDRRRRGGVRGANWAFYDFDDNPNAMGGHSPFLGEAAAFMAGGLGEGPTRRANWWERFTGDAHSRATAAGTFVGTNAILAGNLLLDILTKYGKVMGGATAVGLLSGAVIKGFQWWYKKTSDLDSTKAIYDAIGMRSYALDYLSDPDNKEKVLKDVPHFGDIDIMHGKSAQIEAEANTAVDALMKLVERRTGIAEGQASWLHTLLAYLGADMKEREAHIKFSKEMNRLKWARTLMKAIDPRDPMLETLEAIIKSREEQAGMLYREKALLHELGLATILPDFMTKNNALDGPLTLHGVRFSPESYDRNFELLSNTALSPELKRHIQFYRQGGNLPMPPIDASGSLVRGGIQDKQSLVQAFDRAMQRNPHMTININVGTIYEGTLDELTRKVEVAVEDTMKGVYRDWGDANDGAIY